MSRQPLDTDRLKRLIASLLVAAAMLLAVAALLTAGSFFVESRQGADPSVALNVAVTDEEIDRLIRWDLGRRLDRELDPIAREQVAETWVRAWQRINAVMEGSGQDGTDLFVGPLADRVGETGGTRGSMAQYGHTLEPTFHSIDGSILGMQVVSDLERRVVDGPGRRSLESWETVMVLSDGNWRILRLTRVGGFGQDRP